jgi:hypothetical protein
MTKITDPLVRPLAGRPSEKVQRIFDQACEKGELVGAAQALHELSHRKNWAARSSTLVAQLTDKFPMMRTAVGVAERMSSDTEGSKRVYVVLIRNSNGQPAFGLYVGKTGLSPEKRLLNHLTGHKASSVVKKNGVCLLPMLYQHLNPMSDAEALELEAELKLGFEEAGLLAFGGH